MVENQYKLILISCLKNAVCTKNRNKNDSEFTEGVTEQYKKIERILISLENNCQINFQEDIVRALICLKKIFDTKKVPFNEQTGRFSEIVDFVKDNKSLHEEMMDAVIQILKR